MSANPTHTAYKMYLPIDRLERRDAFLCMGSVIVEFLILALIDPYLDVTSVDIRNGNNLRSIHTVQALLGHTSFR